MINQYPVSGLQQSASVASLTYTNPDAPYNQKILDNIVKILRILCLFPFLFAASSFAATPDTSQDDDIPILSEDAEDMLDAGQKKISNMVTFGDESQGDDMPLLSEGQEKALDSGQQKASVMITDAASWFDNFFDDDRYTTEENHTRAKVKLSFGYSKNDDADVNLRINWRIHLPKLSKKANFIISAGEDDDFDVDGNALTNPNSDEKDELTAAIQYFVKTGERFNISTTFGASTSYLYGGLRFRHFHDFGSWQGRFVDRLRYYTDDGWENRVSYDLERHFTKRWLFRTTAAHNWFEEEDGFKYSFKFRLYQLLNQESALSYEVENYFETKPDNILTDMILRVRYRQRFYRDWLILEIAPQV